MRYYTRDDLKGRGLGWTNKHLLSLEAADRFPRRVYLSERTVVWVADEIEAFLAAKASGRYVTRVITPRDAA